MKLTLDIRKSVEENAASYFEKAKKDKKKIEGARKIVEEYKKKLSTLETEKVETKSVIAKPVKKEWHEKFRWFISSDSFLVIGGRDATTNEIIIKKYTEKEDVVFHTETPGSPFVVVKKEQGREIPEATMEEAAVLTAVFSKAWKQGLAGMSVFSVKPGQVSKTAKPGEYIAKGAFMIYGEKKFYKPSFNYAIGIYQDKDQSKVMGGPVSAVQKHCKQFIEIVQGDDKLSDVAKLIKHRIGGELDDIIRVLPANCKARK